MYLNIDKDILMLFHYCDQSAFINIIKSKVLWASDLKKMNDPSELLHGPNILSELYDSIFPNSKVSLDGDDDSFSNDNLYLACSMSKNGDLLSQWRAYSNDGAGFSIGIDQDDLIISNIVDTKSGTAVAGYELKGVPDFEIHNMFYSEKKFREYYKSKMNNYKEKSGTPFDKEMPYGFLHNEFFLKELYSAGCLLKSKLK